MTPRVLLIVPPMAHLSWPTLGVHVLQACGRAAGFHVDVLYANVLFAARIGHVEYANLANGQVDWMLGERLFAHAAFGRESFAEELEAFWATLEGHNARAGEIANDYLDHLTDISGVVPRAWGTHYERDDLLRFARAADGLVEELGERIAALGYQVVGASTSFDQTAPSLAILAAVKARDPQVTTILGGANCEGVMAEGIRSLGAPVDHVFSGECERVFVDLLEALAAGRESPPIIEGAPCHDLDALPPLDYDAYFDQLKEHLPAMNDTPLWITYETSRGCWWGEKQHCTFCGLNGLGMGFREKSPARAVEELRSLVERYPTRRISMTDNIMPHSYHKTFIPALEAAGIDAHVFYEQKANLTLARVHGLARAGVNAIQPGIEALSSSLLALMRKGVLARQNVALLRYAIACDVQVKWNLLYDFPGDDAQIYRETLALVPLLRHLTPPVALVRLSVDRFSPYHDRGEAFGVSQIEPLDCYGEVFPKGADLEKLAYHFKATWSSAAQREPELLGQLWAEVQRWLDAWSQARPLLQLRRDRGDTWSLTDTRGLGGPTFATLSTPQAAAVAVGGPLGKVPTERWALAAGYAVALDGWCVPLAVADPDTLQDLEDRFRQEEGRKLQVIGG